MKNLYTKILAVMKDVEYLQKDDSVKAGYESYKAISEEKVTTSIGNAMRKHGLIIYPVDIKEKREDFEVVRNSGKTGIDRLATVTVTYKIADPESGEVDQIMSCGTGVDTQDKAIGKAMTYAYKYALLRTFAIPTGEDPDKVASEDKQTTANARQTAQEAAANTKASTVANNQKTANSGAQTGQAANSSAKTANDPVLTKAQLKELVEMCMNDDGSKNDELVENLKNIYQQMGYQKSSDIKQSDFIRIKDALAGMLLPFDINDI